MKNLIVLAIILIIIILEILYIIKQKRAKKMCISCSYAKDCKKYKN